MKDIKFEPCSNLRDAKLWEHRLRNDSHRNQFYWDALAACVKGKCVMDIGGSV